MPGELNARKALVRIGHDLTIAWATLGVLARGYGYSR
jgi:hypothetical protein